MSKLSREELYQELIAVGEQKGEITPHTVLDAARDASHPLHDRFEWDDSVAGEAYRRAQAGDLIRSVKVVYRELPTGEERTTRAFSSVPRGQGKRVYEPTAQVLQNDISRTILLRECERELKALKVKFGNLSEFADMLRAAAI